MVNNVSQFISLQEVSVGPSTNLCSKLHRTQFWHYFFSFNYEAHLNNKRRIICSFLYSIWQWFQYGMKWIGTWPLHQILLFSQGRSHTLLTRTTGADPGGGAPPLKLEKIWFFCRKIVIFHTKYLKNFRASLRNRKK